MVDSIKVLEKLKQIISTVIPESYLVINTATEVTYPYLVYNFDTERITDEIEGFSLEIDIFDDNSSYKRLLELENTLKEVLNDKKELSSDMYLRITYIRSNTIPTLLNGIKRRNMQFYCKIDWRK